MAGSLFLKIVSTVVVTASLFFIKIDSAAAQNQIDINLNAGISFRTTIMNVFDFKPIEQNPLLTYNYEKSIQGLALSPGLQVHFKDLIFDYSSRLRYDYVTHYYDPSSFKLINVINGDSIFGSDTSIDEKEFIVDHNFNVLVKKKKISYGVGMSLVNPGKGFYNENPKGTFYHIDIGFKTYNALVIIPIKEILDLEIKILYIPEDMAENPDDDYLSYSFRVFYKFPLVSLK